MADAENDQQNVDKVTGKDYDKTKAPLISKKGIVIVVAVFAVYTLLLVLLGVVSGGGGETQAKETDEPVSTTTDDTPGDGSATITFPTLYKLGRATATVRVANTTRMVTVGSVWITVDEALAPGIEVLLLDDGKADDIKQRILIVIENTLRSYAYEQLQEGGMKEKLESILPNRISEELGLKEGAIGSVLLRDYRLPK